MKLIDLTTLFLADICEGKRNETPAAYKSKLQHLINFLGADYEPITQQDINRFKKYLLERKTKRKGGQIVREELSPFTIRTIISTTKHLLNWAYAKGYISQQCTIRNIPQPQPQPKPCDQITIDALIKAAQGTGQEWERARNLALIYVLRDTGCRVGAAAALEIGSVDLRTGSATSSTKGGKYTNMFFSPATVAALREWIEHRNKIHPADYKVFTGNKKTGLTRGGIHKTLKRLASAAGLVGARINPHSFRHAFARDSLTAGADISIVCDMMGHSSIWVTHAFYARWANSELHDFHNKYSPGKNLPAPIISHN